MLLKNKNIKLAVGLMLIPAMGWGMQVTHTQLEEARKVLAQADEKERGELESLTHQIRDHGRQIAELDRQMSVLKEKAEGASHMYENAIAENAHLRKRIESINAQIGAHAKRRRGNKIKPGDLSESLNYMDLLIERETLMTEDIGSDLSEELFRKNIRRLERQIAEVAEMKKSHEGSISKLRKEYRTVINAVRDRVHEGERLFQLLKGDEVNEQREHEQKQDQLAAKERDHTQAIKERSKENKGSSKVVDKVAEPKATDRAVRATTNERRGVEESEKMKEHASNRESHIGNTEEIMKALEKEKKGSSKTENVKELQRQAHETPKTPPTLEDKKLPEYYRYTDHKHHFENIDEIQAKIEREKKGTPEPKNVKKSQQPAPEVTKKPETVKEKITKEGAKRPEASSKEVKKEAWKPSSLVNKVKEAIAHVKQHIVRERVTEVKGVELPRGL